MKQQYPWSGKKKDSMVASIANQEIIEHFIQKLNDARAELNQQDKPKRCIRTSPSNHYYIAESSRSFDNLTAWLAEHLDDSAFNVSWFHGMSPQTDKF